MLISFVISLIIGSFGNDKYIKTAASNNKNVVIANFPFITLSYFIEDINFSASKADIQPVPAAVTA